MSDINDIKTTLKEVKEHIIKERREWLKQYSSESLIKEEVFNKLNADFNKLIIKALNVEEALKGYYSAPISKYIKDSVTAAVQQWSNENISSTPHISEEDKEEVKDFFKRVFLKELKKHAEQLASDSAKDYVKEMLTKSLEENE